MRIFCAVIVLFCLVLSPATAQYGDDGLVWTWPITAEKVPFLEPLAMVGNPLPTGMVWSDDGKYLAIGTTRETKVYRSEDVTWTPLTIPAAGIPVFNEFGELVVGGKRWDVKTGLVMGDVLPPDERILSPSGQIEALPRREGTENFLDLVKSSGETVTLNFGEEKSFRQIVFSPDEKTALLLLFYHYAQLWDIERGVPISEAWLPIGPEIAAAKFSTDGQLAITASAFYSPYGASFENVTVVDVKTGLIVAESSFDDIVFSPNGELFAFTTGEVVEVWSDHKIGEFSPESEGLMDVSYAFHPSGYFLAVAVENINTREVVYKVYIDEEANELSVYEYDESHWDYSFPGRLVHYSSRGSFLIAADSSLFIWQGVNDSLVAKVPIEGTASEVKTNVSNTLLLVTSSLESGEEFQTVYELNSGQALMQVSTEAIVSPDFSQAAYWQDGTVHIADIHGGQTELDLINPYLGELTEFNPVLNMAVFSERGAYDFWTGEWVFGEYLGGAADWIKFSEDGSRFAIGDGLNPQHIEVRETAAPDTLIQTFEIPDVEGGEWQLSPAGTMLYRSIPSCGWAIEYRFWSVDLGIEILSGPSCSLPSYQFTQADNQLLRAEGNSVFTFDLTEITYEAIAERRFGATQHDWALGNPPIYGGTQRFEVSDSETYFALGTWRRDESMLPPYAISYDVAVYETEMVLGDAQQELTSPVLTIPESYAALFSPDERMLLTEDSLWDITTATRLIDLPTIQTAVFSPDSALLVAALDSEVVV